MITPTIRILRVVGIFLYSVRFEYALLLLISACVCHTLHGIVDFLLRRRLFLKTRRFSVCLKRLKDAVNFVGKFVSIYVSRLLFDLQDAALCEILQVIARC